MKSLVAAVGLLAVGCAGIATPRFLTPPPLACGAPSWEGPTKFVITCQNAVPPKGAESTWPQPALVNASMAALQTESDYFYVEEARLDAAAKVFQLRGVAWPTATAPEGKVAIYTGAHVQPAEAEAIKVQARERRCQSALGNPASSAEEQQSCSAFLAWREQIRMRQVQEDMRRDQAEAQRRQDEQIRRQGILDALRDDDIKRELRRSRREAESRTTTTECHDNGVGRVRCTTR